MGLDRSDLNPESGSTLLSLKHDSAIRRFRLIPSCFSRSRQRHAAIGLEVSPPRPPQVGRAAAMALVEEAGRQDAVRSEMPKTLTKLTPGGQQAHRFRVPDDDG